MQPNVQPVPGTRVPCYVFESDRDATQYVADAIAEMIRWHNELGQKTVLGLATGSTPVSIYRKLIRAHQEEGLDFSNVVTFNLDEYYGLSSTALQSYHRFMRETFFDHVNIPDENVHVPDGTVVPTDVSRYCRDYEAAIRRAGGIDIQLLGIGRNGHIGFNEPFGPKDSRTRLITLDRVTRMDAASDFFKLDNVPTQALTMGVGTIFEAKKVFLLAFGEHKARIVREAVEGPLTERVPASFLQEHTDAAFLLDAAAADELTARATPWVLDHVAWNDALVKRAVLWLCEKTQKSLLKLDDDDFRQHGLYWLLRQFGDSSRIAHRVFRAMMETIEYHPSGSKPQKVLCFSPHPDDDVISMGGTLLRLIEDGHDVHVAYMTSGNIAVFDHDARQIADLLTELNRQFAIDDEKSLRLETEVSHAIVSKKAGEPDSQAVRKIKSAIRWSEAKSAAGVCGIKEENLHFLDLPFYQTGTVAKKPPTEEDVRMVRELIERIDPGQLYVAGDLSDPHGTHRVCAQLIFEALRQIEASGKTRPDVLLYRGAWQEWAPHVIDIAVPLSPQYLRTKKEAIFRHESQKDTALFPGPDDPREFWQRAEARNRATADLFNRLGLPEYFGLEAFVRWTGKEL
ncbi:MAG TPA: glucosamine-6-phosphate deaminase [Thermoguttaceae bacterium]|nr:glucosamine-6-phosphate deaminase [Thermoguttaceae bacterium]